MDITTIICHGCKYGGKPGEVEQCNCPNLKAGAILPRTRKIADAIHIATRIAEGKGIKDYNPLPFVAVIQAAEKGICRYHREK